MHQYISIQLFVALVLSAGQSAAPKDAVKETEVYYPTRIGTELVYSTGNGDITERITDVEEKDGSKTVTVCLLLPPDIYIPAVRVLVSKDGLFELTRGKHDLNRPNCSLKLPVKPGEKWETKYTRQGVEYKTTYVVRAPEKVVVPAGEFLAVRVDYEVSKGTAAPVKGSTWYAPGFGCVKSVYGDIVNMLKSFTPGE